MPKIVRTIMLVVIAFTVSGTSTVVLSTPQAEAATKKVWIAPNHGKKYHYVKNCRGLNNAKHKKRITLKKAKKSGYTLCGWEKKRTYKRSLVDNKQAILERQTIFVTLPVKRALPIN